MDMAKRVTIEESLQDEWQRFSMIVAMAAGSRGSRLSVFDMDTRIFFMASAVDCLLSRQKIRTLE